MKKLFGRTGGDKPKLTKPPPPTREFSSSDTTRPIDDQGHAPIYQQFHTTASADPNAGPDSGSPVRVQPQATLRPVQRSTSSGLEQVERGADERWEVVGPHDPYNGPDDSPHPPRAPALAGSNSNLGHTHPARPESPYSTASSYAPSVNMNVPHVMPAPQGQQRKSKPTKPAPTSTAAALGILNALNPSAAVAAQGSPPPGHGQGMWSEDLPDHPAEERREKRGGFWGRERERSPPRDPKGKGREHNDPAELVRMIGYLVATQAEDWSFVLEVCERTNLNDANGKEAAKALRREFKYSEPQVQLSAAKLWAIMLNNCNEAFAVQCGSRKFLEVIEDILTAKSTSPVVRERLLEVLAGATFASVQRRQDGKKHEKDGYQQLWRKIKTPDRPDGGVPFDTEDAMFNPPTPRRMSAYNTHAVQNHVAPLEPLRSPAHAEIAITGQPGAGGGPGQPHQRPPHAHHKQSRNRVIPQDEDIRRLFQECNVGRGNASLLSNSLTYAKPKDLKKDLIQEFYIKCQASQEFITAQIPWATAGADRSREERVIQISMLPENEQAQHANELTIEEQLLSELLGANEELLEALRMYDDIQRIGLEQQVEAKSRQETRMPRSQMLYMDGNEPSHDHSVGGSYQSSNGSHLVLPPNANGTSGSSRSPTPPSPNSSPAASAMSITNSHAHSHHHTSSVQSGHGPLPRLPGAPITSASTTPNALPPSTPPMQHSIPPSLLAGSLAPPTRFGPRSPGHLQYQRSRTPSPERGAMIAERDRDHDRERDRDRAHTGAGAGSTKAPLPVPPGSHHGHSAGGTAAMFTTRPRMDSHASSDSAAGLLRRLDTASSQRRGYQDDETLTPVKLSEKAMGKRRAVPETPITEGFNHDGSDSDHDWPPNPNEDDESQGQNGSNKIVHYAYDAVAERHEQLLREGKLAMLADMATQPANVVR